MKRWQTLPILLFISCSQQHQEPKSFPIQANNVVAEMTDIMVNDVTNPPLAARFFAYSTLSAYEVLVQSGQLPSMKGKLNEYPSIVKPNVGPYHPELAAILAMMETAGKMQPSGSLMIDKEANIIEFYKNAGISSTEAENSLLFAREISTHIPCLCQKRPVRQHQQLPAIRTP